MDFQLLQYITGGNIFIINLILVVLFSFIIPLIFIIVKKNLSLWVYICLLVGLIAYFPIANGFYKNLHNNLSDILHNYGLLFLLDIICFIGGKVFLFKNLFWKILGCLISLLSLTSFIYLVFIWSLVGL